MRARLIGDRCEQCGKTEGPMVLQHHWHPPTFQQVLREAEYLGIPGNERYQQARAMHEANQARYMSGQDTSTWCSKCAYLKDKFHMVICNRCFKHYHKDHLGMCSHCVRKESDSSCGDLFD